MDKDSTQIKEACSLILEQKNKNIHFIRQLTKEKNKLSNIINTDESTSPLYKALNKNLLFNYRSLCIELDKAILKYNNQITELVDSIAREIEAE